MKRTVLGLEIGRPRLLDLSDIALESNLLPNKKQNMAPNMTEEEASRQKAIDDWLPITASRNAKWWYSAFHNVTAMVGAGVLSLPYAMSHLGW